MLVALFLTLLAAAPQAAANGVIEATIRGTAQPLEIDLLRADESDSWKQVAHESLAAEARRVRFDGLASGVYQLRVRGPLGTEILGAKIAVGAQDTRRTTIAIEPVALTGRVTLGGTPIGEGAVFLTHPDFQWRAPIHVGTDGTFRVPLWQRGKYRYSIKTAAMATPFVSDIELDGASPRFLVDIPDGRIRGIVRDQKSGAPVTNALVTLASKFGESEQYVRTKTDGAGRFDFTGIQDGGHTVRVYPPEHLESAPESFTLDGKTRLRELDVRLDPGRTVPLLVIDAGDDPVDQATVLAVADGKIRARAKTDEDGRTNIAVPEGEAATLFVVPAEGAFSVQRLSRDPQRGRVRVYLPPASSSLLIRARTTDDREMPPFSLLMRYNGELMPAEVADELDEVQGLRLATGPAGEALLRNIPAGSYEFWPYRTEEEAQSIAAAADVTAAPIVVNVRTGENKIAVKFASRR
ncbi:MAG TPA: carboxypeptidase-like regulatory domain-containing protein [Thermoanaerobaculia bacterium]|nr:carboxypeptidase-like regulatory domain-containing protein [Thermoanaerobaculia bacterium]